MRELAFPIFYVFAMTSVKMRTRQSWLHILSLLFPLERIVVQNSLPSNSEVVST